jgi:hypothetical protein
MTTVNTYSTGTVSVSANGTVVTGVGSIWSGVNVRSGDLLQIGDFQTIISDVTGVTGLTIPPWGGGAQSAVAYTIWQTSPLRFVGGQAMADVSALIAVLNGMGTIYAVSGDTPDPSIGEDGQFALKTNTGAWQLWLKVGGVWELQGQPVGTVYVGEWNSSTAYVVNDRVSQNGSSYTAKQPNTNQSPVLDTSFTFWDGAGIKGDKGTSITAGTGVPTGGNSGDLYFRSSTFDIYQNASGTWSIVANVKGPVGATPLLAGTSTTSVTVGTGSKSFTTQTGIAWATGQRLRAVNTAGDRVLDGPVTSYNATTGALVLNVDFFQGVGADSTWTIIISGEQGVQGPAGIAGATGLRGLPGSTGPASTVPGPQGVKGDVGAGLAPSATGTLAQRTAFDGQAQGYEYLQTDVSPFRLFVKASNTTGDWAGPTFIGGNFPVGDMGHITDSVVQIFDFGHIV